MDADRVHWKSLLRPVAVVMALAFAIAIPFAIWGGPVDAALDIESTVETLRATGWAAAAGVGLILSDVFVPVPSTSVMAALGVIYGPLIGGALSAGASIGAGSLAYWLCRGLGRRTAERLAGREGIRTARHLFRRWGFPLIALSRWLPVLPEPIAFMSGLVRVPYGRFVRALASGAVPLGFAFATAGHLGRDMPVLLIAVIALSPVAGFLVFHFVVRRHRR